MNLRPSGYEPDELPDCSIPRCSYYSICTVYYFIIVFSFFYVKYSGKYFYQYLVFFRCMRYNPVFDS